MPPSGCPPSRRPPILRSILSAASSFSRTRTFRCFPCCLGSFARLTRVPSDVAILLCHILGVFLLLLASRRLLSACFHNERARWAGVALLAGVLSVPVAGTAIPIMDPYVTSRSLSTPLALFAIAWYLSERPRRAIAWLAACALIHPQMSLYAAALLGTMELSRRRAAVPEAVPAFGLLALSWVPLPWDLAPAQRSGARGPGCAHLLLRLELDLVRMARGCRAAGSC